MEKENEDIDNEFIKYYATTYSATKRRGINVLNSKNIPSADMDKIFNEWLYEFK